MLVTSRVLSSLALTNKITAVAVSIRVLSFNDAVQEVGFELLGCIVLVKHIVCSYSVQ